MAHKLIETVQDQKPIQLTFTLRWRFTTDHVQTYLPHLFALVHVPKSGYFDPVEERLSTRFVKVIESEAGLLERLTEPKYEFRQDCYSSSSSPK